MNKQIQIIDILISSFKENEKYVVNGRLNKTLLIDDAFSLNKNLISLLLKNKQLTEFFFRKVGDILVFAELLDNGMFELTFNINAGNKFYFNNLFLISNFLKILSQNIKKILGYPSILLQQNLMMLFLNGHIKTAFLKVVKKMTVK